MGIKNNRCDFPDIGTIQNDCSNQIYLQQETEKNRHNTLKSLLAEVDLLLAQSSDVMRKHIFSATERQYKKFIKHNLVGFSIQDLNNRDKETGYIGFFNGVKYFVSKGNFTYKLKPTTKCT